MNIIRTLLDHRRPAGAGRTKTGAFAATGRVRTIARRGAGLAALFLAASLPQTASAAIVIPSDGAAFDFFGDSVSLSGTTGLVGASSDDDNGGSSGSAYVFRNLDTASGTVTEQVKLTASDGAKDDLFGFSVSLSGTTGLVGARGDDVYGLFSGSAYVFRNLDTASGTVTEQVKLIPSDGVTVANFGRSVSLSGTTGLVGAWVDDVNGNRSGSAYVFRNLDTASGTVTEQVKLTPSDGAAGDEFGWSVSLSGTTGLVGANGDDDNGSSSGSAYVFRNLDTASGTVTENVKLTASDGAANDVFGRSVSLSGMTGLVGAPGGDVNGINSGSAYVFRNLDTASGTVTEQVKLTASDGASDDGFGHSVSLDGDSFLIGADDAGTAGKAYSGTVSSVTTLDEGGASREIDGISFESRTDWIIGESTDGNEVTLTSGDRADVTETGMAVYIGQNAGSDNNRLVIEGDLTANEILVGAAGNTGNALEINAGGSVVADLVVIAPGSTIFGSGLIDGDLTLAAGGMLEFSLGNTLEVTGAVSLDPTFGVDDLIGVDSSLPSGIYALIDGTATDFSAMGIENWGSANAYDLGGGKSAYFSQGSLQLNVVPEPETYAAIFGLMGLALAVGRRRKRSVYSCNPPNR